MDIKEFQEHSSGLQNAAPDDLVTQELHKAVMRNALSEIGDNDLALMTIDYLSILWERDKDRVKAVIQAAVIQMAAEDLAENMGII